MEYGAAPPVPIHRTAFSSGERRLFQHPESPELRQPDQLPDVSRIRIFNADAEQLPWYRGLNDGLNPLYKTGGPGSIQLALKLQF